MYGPCAIKAFENVDILDCLSTSAKGQTEGQIGGTPSNNHRITSSRRRIISTKVVNTLKTIHLPKVLSDHLKITIYSLYNLHFHSFVIFKRNMSLQGPKSCPFRHEHCYFILPLK